MSLYTTWTDANKRISSTRDTRYSAEPTCQRIGSAEPVALYWTLTRTSSYAYQYLALTEAAAKSCCDELAETYTRKYAKWVASTVEESDGTVSVLIDQLYSVECPTSITASNAGGSAWEVNVQENETDIIITKEEPESIEDFEKWFQAANVRDAEIGGGIQVAILSGNWHSSTNIIAGQLNVANATVSLLDDDFIVQFKDGTEWSQGPSVTFNPSNNTYSFAATENKTFRLGYYDSESIHWYYSKEWTTTNRKEPAISIATSGAYYTYGKYTNTYRNPPYHNYGYLTIEFDFTTQNMLSTEIDNKQIKVWVNGRQIPAMANSTIEQFNITQTGIDLQTMTFTYHAVAKYIYSSSSIPSVRAYNYSPSTYSVQVAQPMLGAYSNTINVSPATPWIVPVADTVVLYDYGTTSSGNQHLVIEGTWQYSSDLASAEISASNFSGAIFRSQSQLTAYGCGVVESTFDTEHNRITARLTCHLNPDLLGNYGFVITCDDSPSPFHDLTPTSPYEES